MTHPARDAPNQRPRAHPGATYLVPHNLEGPRGLILIWVFCRLGSLAFLAVALTTAFVLRPPRGVMTVIVVVSVLAWAYLWQTSWVIGAWRSGTPYSRFLFGVSDRESAVDGRIRIEDAARYSDDELGAYAWSFRRHIRARFRPLQLPRNSK